MRPAARQTIRASPSDSTRSFLRFLGRFFSMSLAGLSERLIRFSRIAHDTRSRSTASTVRAATYLVQGSMSIAAPLFGDVNSAPVTS
jgi:hypothetical protein